MCFDTIAILLRGFLLQTLQSIVLNLFKKNKYLFFPLLEKSIKIRLKNQSEIK